MLSESVLFALNNVNDTFLEEARELLGDSAKSRCSGKKRIVRGGHGQILTPTPPAGPTQSQAIGELPGGKPDGLRDRVPLPLRVCCPFAGAGVPADPPPLFAGAAEALSRIPIEKTPEAIRCFSFLFHCFQPDKRGIEAKPCGKGEDPTDDIIPCTVGQDEKRETEKRSVVPPAS